MELGKSKKNLRIILKTKSDWIIITKGKGRRDIIKVSNMVSKYEI